MLYAIPQGAPVVLVHVHSNGCDIGDMRQMLQSISEQLRVHVMSFELPGYGLHIGSTCNRRTIDAMAGIVRDFLLEDLGLNPAQVVWYGRSIGSGPAIYQAHFSQTELKKQPAGLIVQCAYASFPELAGHLFGSWVKCLVPVNWPNEAMIRDIHCPLLILHGRADTMIPIAQAERNFAAVSPQAKNLSRFHACECGHNDFNFQRCTLRPIYDFLLGIISSESFPTTHFNIDLDQSKRAFVHHVGPLRNKIPVYSFRRPELDDWIRRVQARKQQVAIEAASSEQTDTIKEDVTAQAMERRGQYAGVMSGFQKQALEGPDKATESDAPKSVEAAPAEGTKPKKKGKKKKKKEEELPPIPDFCELPPLQEIEEALLDPEGLIRTCALRVKDFLAQLQQQIDRIHDLEGKPIEEIVDFVEAEFWASDPLLCLWEEVRLTGDWVRIRLGPFYIDSNGKSGFDPDLSFGRASSSSPDLMRVPLWVFCPTTAHFRCLAEWSLLQSERLLKKFPAKSSGSMCRCNPCRCCRRKRKTRSRRGVREPTTHPTSGGLATWLAAHFANWVDKNEEVKGILNRFVSLYRQPQQALGRSVSTALESAGLSQASKDVLSATSLQQDSPSVAPPSGQNPRQPHQPDSETSPTGTPATPAAREIPNSIPKLMSGLESFASALGQVFSSSDDTPPQDAAWRYADFSQVASSPSGQALRPPWPASMFSAASRMCLRENSGVPGSSLSDFYMRLWRIDAQKVGEPLAIADFKACHDIVCAQPSAIPDRNSDWMAANIILHYNRLPRRPLNEASHDASCDLLRPEARQASLAVNKAMKVFAHSEHRERREQMRQRFRATPKAPLPPEVPPEGELAESRPGPTMGKPANPARLGTDETAERVNPPASLGDSPLSSGQEAPPPSSRDRKSVV